MVELHHGRQVPENVSQLLQSWQQGTGHSKSVVNMSQDRNIEPIVQAFIDSSETTAQFVQRHATRADDAFAGPGEAFSLLANQQGSHVHIPIENVSQNPEFFDLDL